MSTTPGRWPTPAVTPGKAAALGSTLLAAMIVWAALTEVEVVVSAPATARPVGGVAELRAAASGTVLQVPWQEGQQVAAGRPILQLDDTLATARRDAANMALAASRRRLDDLTAAMSLPDDVAPPATLVAEVRLRLETHAGRLAELDWELAALSAELEAELRRAHRVAQLLDIRRERFRAVTQAARLQAMSRFDVLRAEQEVVAQNAELEASRQRAHVLRQRVGAQRSKRGRAVADHRQYLAEAVAAAQLEVAERRVALSEARAVLGDTLVRAPVSGVLDRLEVSVGDFVERGERVAVLVPGRRALAFEARVVPRQAAFLRPGQSCRIKLDALPFPRHGALPCTLIQMARDVARGEGGSSYYRVTVEPAAQRLYAAGQPVRLYPGATATVDVIAGRRRVLGFVTEPLWRFAGESLRER